MISLTVVESTTSQSLEGRDEGQLEALKMTLTDEFEQLTRQIHAEAEAEQVSGKGLFCVRGYSWLEMGLIHD